MQTSDAPSNDLFGHVTAGGSPLPQIETTAQSLLFANAQNLVARWQNIVTRATTGAQQLTWMQESGIFAEDVRLTFNFPDGQTRTLVGINQDSQTIYNSFVNGIMPNRANLATNVEVVEFFQNALHFRFRYVIIAKNNIPLIGDHEAVMLRQNGRYVITDTNVAILLNNTGAAVANPDTPPVVIPPTSAPNAPSVPGPKAIESDAVSQKWVSLNPGAGGQIQDLVLDPLKKDRAFVLSDVDGLYRTENSGNSWQYSFRGLAGTNTLALAVDPQDNKRVYLGTTVGLHVSNDSGRSWQLHPETKRSANTRLLTKTGGREELAVGSVVVDALNPQRIFAGVGNKRDSFSTQATLFRSVDGGSTFQVVQFGGVATSRAQDRSILQLAYDRYRERAFAAIAQGGLWRGSKAGAPGQWTKLGNPPNTTLKVTGVAVTADGTLYAAFGQGNKAGTTLFGSRDQGVSWRALTGKGAPSEDYAFRNLVIDASSGRDRHYLLTAPDNDRAGLFELTIVWSGNTPTVTWERIFWYEDRRKTSFDTGWEGGIYGNKPRPLAYQYTPSSWGERSIWTSGDQTLFKVENVVSETPDLWRNNWRSIYTSAPQDSYSNVEINIGFTGNAITTLGTIETYRSRGWQSTVDMDVSRYGDIIIHSGADHGVIMSWDNGQSWEDVSSPRRAKSQANAIVKQGNSLFLLAHFSGPFDFGAANTEGELWGAKINPASPQPTRWYFLAGGKGKFGSARGLANDVYTNIVVDPARIGRVYVSSRDQGLYVIDNVAELYGARVNGVEPGFYARLPGSPSANEYEGSLVLDPNNSRVLYVANKNKLYQGRREGDNNQLLANQRWRWPEILASQSLMTFDAWDRNGRTVLAAVTVSGGRSQLQFSSNAGASWQQLLTIEDLTRTRTPLFDFSETPPIMFAVTGLGNTLYVSVQTQAPTNLAYGMFAITLAGNTYSTIQDVTGNLPFPKSFRTKVITDPVTAETHLYTASWGSGTWRRAIR
ncbi:MAG: hypothetical protein AAFO06_13490 [Cyanobacteria bacterium J06597_16]